MFNRAFRDVTEDEGLGHRRRGPLLRPGERVRRRTPINCWDDKERWHFWRPITAIRNGDDDTNSRTVGDPTWTSLVSAPPYPDHSSGYNCVTGAFMNTAALFLGKKADLRVTNLALGVTREYDRFLDVPDDTIDARIWLGIHFRTPDVQGARLGKDVARWVDKHYFKRAK